MTHATGRLLTLRCHGRRLIPLVGLVALGTSADVSAERLRVARCGGAQYAYVLNPAGEQPPRPAILLLHGAGGNAAGMISLWNDLAKENGVVLIAPELPLGKKFEEIAPQVFSCLVEDAGRDTRIDPRRVYVFGYSMGGYLAYDAAMFDSERFAAVAVFGASIAPEYDWILGRARRKTPIAVYTGDRDRAVPLEGVRRTRDILTRNGFSVRYRELEGQDHFYAAAARWVNADAWKFFDGERLP